MGYKDLKKYKAYKARLFEELTTNPNDKRHGTHTGYTYGCRCEKCLQAKKESRKK